MSTTTVTALPKRQQGDMAYPAMMVLLSTGQLIGWGDNVNGSLATGIATATSAPAQWPLFDPNTTMPPSSATIVDWSFVSANLYVVFSNGWVYSSGQNDYGQLGHGDTTDRRQLSRIEYFVTNSLSITKVWAAGSAWTTQQGGCVYFQASDYSMYACGVNSSGNLGNASTPTSNVSTPAPCAGIGHTTNHVVDVRVSAASNGFACYMLFNDGSLKVAGYNVQGQLGNNTNVNVSGAFVAALKTGGASITNVASISVTAGYNGTTIGGSALAVDTSGNVWTTGYNAYGQLGLGSVTSQKEFTQVTTLSNITAAGLGGGFVGYGYALDTTGNLWTWGYNGQNNLFYNNATTPKSTPAIPAYTPGAIAKVFFPKGDNLNTNSQLIVLTTSGLLAYAGIANGQTGLANTLYAGAYDYIPTPAQFLNGSETISDVFVHGDSTAQRLFILSNLGNLYACGSNVNSVCTGGQASESVAANVNWYQISFASL